MTLFVAMHTGLVPCLFVCLFVFLIVLSFFLSFFICLFICCFGFFPLTKRYGIDDVYLAIFVLIFKFQHVSFEQDWSSQVTML